MPELENVKVTLWGFRIGLPKMCHLDMWPLKPFGLKKSYFPSLNYLEEFKLEIKKNKLGIFSQRVITRDTFYLHDLHLYGRADP